MLDIEKNQNRTTHLYMEVYEYYRKLILDGKMTPGSKMPSLRKCSQELKLSRTTIETAYLQLAADGYIMAKAQSGYYVTEIASQQQYSATRPVILPISVTIIQSTWNRSWMNGRNGDFPRMESIQDFWLTRSRQIRSWIFSEDSGKRRPWCWWIRLWEIMAVLMGFIQKVCGNGWSSW